MIQNTTLHKAPLFHLIYQLYILPDITKSKILCIYKDTVNKIGKVRIYVTWRRIRVTIVAVKTAVSTPYSECMCLYSCLSYPACKKLSPYYIVICGLPGSTIFFQCSSWMAQFSGKRYWTQNECLFLYNLCLKHLILRRIQRDIITNVHSLHVKDPLFLSDSKERWIFSTDFRKIFIYKISWKFIWWEPSCSMRTDGQTYDATSRFSQFCTHLKTKKLAFSTIKVYYFHDS